MKKIMILGASVLQVPAIIKAKEMGYKVIVLDMDSEAIGFQIEGVTSEVISTIDIESVLECAKRHKIDGIMTIASDMPMRTIAKVSKELNLVGIDEETALKATNKYFMREALKKHNVPIPIYYKVSNENEFYTAVKCILERGYKCIAKPADNSGSRGVTLIKEMSKSILHEAYNHAKKYSRLGDIMIEEFLCGPEVSVETISYRGECSIIQITDKITSGAPYFVEMGHSQPSKLNSVIKKEIIDVTKEALNAVGVTNGPSHTEIIVTENGPKIVELGARLGGDCITTHLVPLSTGVDMVECCIKIAMGDTPNVLKKYDKGAAITYIEADKGKISNIRGLEEAMAIHGIKQINFVHGIGEYSKQIESSVDRIGFIIAQGKNENEAIDLCEKAKSLVKVEVI